jgi:hypothetical protein
LLSAYPDFGPVQIDLKEQAIKKSFIGDFPYIIPIKLNLKNGATYCNMTNFDPALCGIANGPNFKIEYLGEFETEFENILGC